MHNAKYTTSLGIAGMSVVMRDAVSYNSSFLIPNGCFGCPMLYLSFDIIKKILLRNNRGDFVKKSEILTFFGIIAAISTQILLNLWKIY